MNYNLHTPYQVIVFSISKIFFIILFLLPDLYSQIESEHIIKRNPDSLYVLDTITIVSLRGGKELLNSPYSIVYADKKEIQQGETGISLDEITTGLAGISVNNRHNFSLGDKIIIRGIGARSSFGVRGIKILYDGIPLTLPDGQTQLNNIDLNSAGRIEILKGPASSLYGNSAGGVINIQTEYPSANLVSVAPQFSTGSFGLQKYSAKVSGSAGNNSYLINFNKLNYKGYREHSASEFININTVLNSIISGNLFLKTVISYFTSPYLLNPSSLNKTDAENTPSVSRAIIKEQGVGERSSQFQGGISINWFNNNYNFENTVYYAKRSLLNPIPGRIIELKRSTGGLRSLFSVKFKPAFMEINLQFGSDFEIQLDNRKESENSGLVDVNIKPENIFSSIQYGSRLIDQGENVFNAGPFISSEFIFSEELRLVTGLRLDYYEFKVTDKNQDDFTDDSGLRTMKNLSPMVGLVYRPADEVKLYANYSTAFLTPTTNELSNQPDKEGGFNPILNPEKIYNYETGMLLFLNRFSLSAAIYYMNFTHMLIPFQVNSSEESFYRNAGKARNIGTDLSAEYDFNDNLKASVNYSYMNFIFKDYVYEIPGSNTNYIQLKNNKVPGIPEHKIGISALYYYSGFFSKLNICWNDKFFTNDLNGQTVAGNPVAGIQDQQNFINNAYTEVDLRMGYNFPLSFFNLEVFAGINNLLDSKYNGSIVPNAAGNRFFEPSPLRNWYAGIKGSF